MLKPYHVVGGGQHGLLVKADSTHSYGPGSIPNAFRKKGCRPPLLDRIDV